MSLFSKLYGVADEVEYNVMNFSAVADEELRDIRVLTTFLRKCNISLKSTPSKDCRV